MSIELPKDAEGRTIPLSTKALYAANRLDEVKKKLSELNDLGLSTQENEDVVSRLAKRIEIINKCVEDLKKIDRRRMSQR